MLAWAIPARAGRTCGSVGLAQEKKGHPCACRENQCALVNLQADKGPSLRVQGEHVATEVAEYNDRAIPARAGRTNQQTSDNASH